MGNMTKFQENVTIPCHGDQQNVQTLSSYVVTNRDIHHVQTTLEITAIGEDIQVMDPVRGVVERMTREAHHPCWNVAGEADDTGYHASHLRAFSQELRRSVRSDA